MTNTAETDFYYTINSPKRTEIKVKGSKFIATAASVSSKDEAEQFIEQIRSEFYDATHNCFAYRIGNDGLEYRSSDDGEPNGSAGKPILFAINKFDISDVVVVVTRFFGGTKLGVGGLARAYSGAASEVLNLCKKKKINITIPVNVFCTYEDISAVKKLIDETAIKFDEHYTDSIEFLVYIPVSKTEQFTHAITSSTAGRAGTKVLNEKVSF